MDWNYSYYASFGSGDGSETIEDSVELNKRETATLIKAIRDGDDLNSALDSTLIARLHKTLAKEEAQNLCDAGDEYALQCRREKRNPFDGGYSLYITLEEPEDMDSDQMEEVIRSAFQENLLPLVDAIVEANPDLGEPAFRISLQENCAEYAHEHVADYDLNDTGEGYSSYLNETDDPELIDMLFQNGAFRFLEEYSDYQFALETVNMEFLAFDDDFKWYVFDKFLKAARMTVDEVIFAMEEHEYPDLTKTFGDVDFEELMTAFGAEVNDGQFDLAETSMYDQGNWSIIQLLDKLGMRPEFEGSESSFEKIGVYCIAPEPKDDDE